MKSLWKTWMFALVIWFLIPTSYSYSFKVWELTTNTPQGVICGGIARDYVNNKLYSTFAWNGLMQSTDDGASWSLTGLQINFPWSVVTTSNGTILVGTWDSNTDYIYRSIDNGVTFTPVVNWWPTSTQNLLNGFYSMIVTPSNQIYAIMNLDNLLFKSTDDGATWTWTTTGVPHVLSVGDLVSIKIDAMDNIMIGTLGNEAAIYYSNDGGDNWSRLNHGLRAADVWALDLTQRAIF